MCKMFQHRGSFQIKMYKIYMNAFRCMSTCALHVQYIPDFDDMNHWQIIECSFKTLVFVWIFFGASPNTIIPTPDILRNVAEGCKKMEPWSKQLKTPCPILAQKYAIAFPICKIWYENRDLFPSSLKCLSKKRATMHPPYWTFLLGPNPGEAYILGAGGGQISFVKQSKKFAVWNTLHTWELADIGSAK